MALPPDRSHVITEQRRAGAPALGALSAPEAVALMIDDHRQVAAALEAIAPPLALFIEALVERLRAGGRLVYVGAGTSGRLGVLDASECPPTFQSEPGQVIGLIAGGDAALRRSSEGREDDRDGAREQFDEIGLDARDTVLGIAAGGTTPYTLGAVARARTLGAMTALLACSAPPPGVVVDHLLLLDTGPELLTGSTRLKAGSATKLALNTITTVAFARLGKVYGDLMVDLRATNDKLRDRAIRILRELCPELSREEADEALAAGGGDLKVAIVMRRMAVSAADARRRLAAVGGSLHALLDGAD